MLKVEENQGVTCLEGNVVSSGIKLGTVYAFLVDGMLVDTGPQIIESEFTSYLLEQSFELVTLTHSHEDHSGNAPWIQKTKQVPIYIHPLGVEICAQASPYPKYRQLTWGVREKFRAIPLGETIQTQTRQWRVIYTPGHAEDHVSLLDEGTGRLFSGDLFVTPRTKVIMDSESIPVIMNSIRTLLKYGFESMFCCHAGYIPNGKEMLIKKLEYLENLYGEVENLYKKGLSIEEIKHKLFPKDYPIIRFSSGEWDSLHIISSIAAHFELEKDKSCSFPETL
ncbi:MBL fold metallo-hydrolase [Neobacillus muris]|uniref:MBL fold metallo-hydrolase n=1 Tax=Neobacillus muris TaxID=2941334 RepID=UPI00203E39A9|nr:MBL fold metallo-hydrolase [Neobacillus muris]